MKPVDLEDLRYALAGAGETCDGTLHAEWVNPDCDLDLRVRLKASTAARRSELTFNPCATDPGPWDGNPLSAHLGRGWLTAEVERALRALTRRCVASGAGLHLDIDHLRQSPAPLLHQLRSSHAPQAAYLTLDHTGCVCAEWSEELPEDTPPPDVVSGRTVRWAVEPTLAGDALHAALTSEPLHGLLTRVHAGHLPDPAQPGRWHLTRDAVCAGAETAAVLRAVAAYPDRLVQVCWAEDFITGFGRRTLAEIWGDSALEQAAQHWREQAANAAARVRLLLRGNLETALLTIAHRAWQQGDPALTAIQVEQLEAAQLITPQAAQTWRSRHQTA